MNKKEFNEELILCKKRAIPIVAINGCIDQTASLLNLLDGVTSQNSMVFSWENVGGLRVEQCSSAAKAQTILNDVKIQLGYLISGATSLEAVKEILGKTDTTGESCAFIFLMGDRLLSQQNTDYLAITQHLNNLRDDLARQGCTVYLLGINFSLPPELVENVVIINEPLPSDEERRKIIKTAFESQGGEATESDTELISDLLAGTSLFAGANALYLSLTADGFERDKLLARKIQTINNTEGLTVTEEKRDFSSLGGLNAIKDYYRKLTSNNLKPRLIVRIEEVEKALAGSGKSGNDSSGVSQGFLSELLNFMQDTNSLGMLFTGIYGAAKSATTKAMAGESKALAVEMNLGSMKAGLVGESERNIRRALQVIRNISGEHPVLFVATCNRVEQLPPEFRRRFNLGTFFFDFPTPEEKAEIWRLYMGKYGVSDSDRLVDDSHWTGAEIESCCRNAYLMGCSIGEASQYIVPMYQAARAEVNELQSNADGKYLSASQQGVYRKAMVSTSDRSAQARTIQR